MMIRVSLLQCQSGDNVDDNLKFIDAQLAQLPRDHPQHLVVLPECCLLFGGHESQQMAVAGSDQTSALKRALSSLAKRYQIYLVAGTIPILADDNRLYSRSYLFDDGGATLGHYDKLHLFDVEVADNTSTYRESDTFCPGDYPNVIDTPFGKIGMAICYDLRFSELFRVLRQQGADIIVLPAAFTRVTGAAHWLPLLRARAIETQCFVLAAAQWGQQNRQTWGHSSIIGPWGDIIAQKAEQCGLVTSEINLADLAAIRTKMPIIEQDRFGIAPLKQAPISDD